MRHVIFLRHAKSSWALPGVDDFDRPLNDRGHKAAPKMAAWMIERNILPDVILCSSALRTQSTLAHIQEAMSHHATSIIEPDLYLASSQRLIQHVARFDNRFQTALVIAHNPGIHDAALGLLRAEERRMSGELRARFPTCACAVIALDLENWSDIENDTGELYAYMTPRLLVETSKP